MLPCPLLRVTSDLPMTTPSLDMTADARPTSLMAQTLANILVPSTGAMSNGRFTTPFMVALPPLSSASRSDRPGAVPRENTKSRIDVSLSMALYEARAMFKNDCTSTSWFSSNPSNTYAIDGGESS